MVRMETLAFPITDRDSAKDAPAPSPFRRLTLEPAPGTDAYIANSFSPWQPRSVCPIGILKAVEVYHGRGKYSNDVILKAYNTAGNFLGGEPTADDVLFNLPRPDLLPCSSASDVTPPNPSASLALSISSPGRTPIPKRSDGRVGYKRNHSPPADREPEDFTTDEAEDSDAISIDTDNTLVVDTPPKKTPTKKSSTPTGAARQNPPRRSEEAMIRRRAQQKKRAQEKRDADRAQKLKLERLRAQVAAQPPAADQPHRAIENRSSRRSSHWSDNRPSAPPAPTGYQDRERRRSRSPRNSVTRYQDRPG